MRQYARLAGWSLGLLLVNALERLVAAAEQREAAEC